MRTFAQIETIDNIPRYCFPTCFNLIKRHSTIYHSFLSGSALVACCVLFVYCDIVHDLFLLNYIVVREMPCIGRSFRCLA